MDKRTLNHRDTEARRTENKAGFLCASVVSTSSFTRGGGCNPGATLNTHTGNVRTFKPYTVNVSHLDNSRRRLGIIGVDVLCKQSFPRPSLLPSLRKANQRFARVPDCGGESRLPSPTGEGQGWG